MPAIQHLLQRWGFVKLGRYGLVLTPEGRILSMRPAVLDDGSGARIVGWQDSDLAETELRAWEPAKPASVRAVASRVVMPQAAAPKSAASSTEIIAITESYVSSSVSASASAVMMPAAVAPEPMVDEDDWEWTIALARARVAAEEVEAAAAAGPPPPPMRAAPAKTRPMAAVAMKDPASSGEWPKTETIGAIDYDNSRVAPRPAVAIPRVTPAAPPRELSRAAAPSPELPRAPAPSTVIPVPALPSMQNVGRASRLEPVVRTGGTQDPPASLRRLAKGTGPVDPTTASRTMPAMSDDTEPNLSVGDRTTPGIALPPAARAVQLPSVKRRNATRG
jgi:hypothetical protein